MEVPRYAYCPEYHKAFELPPGPTRIWRYMTLPKLLGLLKSNKLFFCRAAQFEDPFEGAIPVRTEERLRAWEAKYVSKEVQARHRAQRRDFRKNVAISCWHMSEHESAAMWSLYGLTGEGVAIRSTVERLTRALPEWYKKGWQGPGAIYIGKVNYIDYAAADFDPSQMYAPYVHKWESFKHEREVRAVTLITKAARAAALAGAPTEFELNGGGIAIPVVIETLVESIFIAPTAPDWFQEVVASAVGRFGFQSIPVLKSPLAAKPIY